MRHICTEDVGLLQSVSYLGWLVGWLVGWFGWLVVRLVIWLIVWLVGSVLSICTHNVCLIMCKQSGTKNHRNAFRGDSRRPN